MTHVVGNGPVTAAIGKDMTLAFDPTRMFPRWESFTEMERGLLVLGVGNKIKDSHASITYDKHGDDAFDLKCERAEETLAQLYRGEYAAGRTTDPVESELKSIVRKQAMKNLKARGVKNAPKETVKAEIDSIRSRPAEMAGYRSQAKRIAAIKAETTPIDTGAADEIAESVA